MSLRCLVYSGPVRVVRRSLRDALRFARRLARATDGVVTIDCYDAGGPRARYTVRLAGDKWEVRRDDGWANPWARKH
mgnify:CR=1 FL=1